MPQKAKRGDSFEFDNLDTALCFFASYCVYEISSKQQAEI